MGVLKNDVGRPSNKTIMIRKIFKRMLLAILLVGCFILGYKLEEIFHKENEKEIQKVELKEAKTLIDNYVYDDYYLMTEEKYSEDYKTILAIKRTNNETYENYSCKDLFGNHLKTNEYGSGYSLFYDNKEIFGVCYDSENDLREFYSYDHVNNTYHNLFGDENNAKKGNITTDFDGGAIIYQYSEEKDGYVSLSCECGGVWFGESQHIYDAYIKDNKLYITFGFVLFENISEKELTLSNGKETLDIDLTNFDYNPNHSYEEISKELDFVFDKYEEKIPKYEIVFKKKDTGYLYYSIKEIK